MQKKPLPFIDLVESKQLLSPEIVAELRRQVAESKTRLTPELLAKLLVDNGHLTKFQAKKLITELNEQVGSGDEGEELGLAPAAEEEEQELGFAPEPEEAKPVPVETEEENENLAAIFIDDAKPKQPDTVYAQPVEVAEVVSEGQSQPIVEAVEAVEAVEVAKATPSAKSSKAVADLAVLGGTQRPTSKPVLPATSKDSPWDSFRILGVGLILALVLVAGYFLLNWFIRGNADDRLARADSSYESRSYETAANMYADFADDFPTHEEASFASVRAALSKLRLDSEGTPDPEVGLETALEVLPTISEEQALGEQRSEVAGVLIALAGKFNERADAAETTARRKHLMSRLDALLELTNDPRFVGPNERNQQAPTLNRISEDRARILREIGRDEKLAAALDEIDARLAAQETLAAYEVRKKLIDEYPLLEADEGLNARIRQASDIQQTLVQKGSLRPSLSQADPSQETGRTYVLGHVYGQPATALRGQTVFVKVKGSVYGLDAATGEILWRRFVGREFKSDPIRIGETSDVDALVCEPGQGRVTRVAGRTGEIRWAVDFETPIHMPVAEGGDFFVSSLDGHVAGLDLESGQAKWVTKLPQPLETQPGIAFGKPHLYVVAEHSNLYVISRNDGECQEVFYTGHRPSAVAVAPKLLLGQLLVLENVNTRSSKIRILSTSDVGLELADAQVPILMDGNIFVDPQVDGRKVVIQSDLGEIVVLDIEPTLETQKVSELASVPKNLLQPKLSWSVFRNNKLWVADTRFTRFNLQVSLGKLGRVWAEDDGDRFSGPPQLFGDSIIIHTRRLRGNQGNRAAAVKAEDGKPIWEIDLGVPITMLNAADNEKVDVVNSGGMLYGLNEQTLRSQADANPGKGRAAMNFGQPVELTPTVTFMLNKSRPNQFAVYANRRGKKLTIMSANFGGSRPSCDPIAVGRSVGIGLENGQYSLIDPSNGATATTPYQPPIQAGKRVLWNTPVYWGDSQTLVTASNLLKLVRLSTEPALRPLTEKDLEVPLRGPLCKIGSDVAAVRSTGSQYAMVLFDSLSLDEKGKLALDSQPLAGPYGVNGGSLIQTNNRLVYISGEFQKSWELEFPKSVLVGPPVEVSGNFVVASRAGHLWVIDSSTGEAIGKTDVGQSLSSTPLIMDDGIMIGSDEGVVLQLPLPAGLSEAASSSPETP